MPYPWILISSSGGHGGSGVPNLAGMTPQQAAQAHAKMQACTLKPSTPFTMNSNNLRNKL